MEQRRRVLEGSLAAVGRTVPACLFDGTVQGAELRSSEAVGTVLAEERKETVLAEEREEAVLAEEREEAVLAEKRKNAVLAEEREEAVLAEERKKTAISLYNAINLPKH